MEEIFSKAAEYTVDPILQQLSYLFKPKSKFQNRRDQLKKLKQAREKVQQDVNEANWNGKKIFSYVDEWLSDVMVEISKEAEFQKDEEKAKERCLGGLCPNFKSRYQLSRKAAEETNTIAQLLEQKGQFDSVSHPAAPEGEATRPVKDYEVFESRTCAFDDVKEALKDSNLSIIGVYGMGGIGKTTLVKHVARQAKEENLFDKVVMATVTQSFDINKIQDQIAEELGGQKLDKVSDFGRAGELRSRFEKNKKILVILDDIWVKLDLEAVGIPYGAECKILLTSRELNVLSLMDSQQNLAIKVLEEDEAWNLFKKMAGDIVPTDDLHPIAIEVAKKCAGLPIAIVTVGKGLKNKNVHEWGNALLELRKPSEINFRGIPADVYSAIELSYKFLEDMERQPTFLLCSIMGHDAVIEDLLIYGKGLGIFHGVDSIQEARDKVLTLVSNLKASCLLLDGSTPKYSNDRREHFDMHDVVRDVAISISSRDQHWLALGRDDVFKEWSDEERMRRCNLISLRDAKVSELPDELECPNLTFFSMVSEGSSLKIPDNFFKGMQRLKVLDFAKMHFSSLPLSISSLKNLHTLCFSWCTLEDIAIIGELKNLEILNLRGSTTATLPREIGQLTKLKLLDLSRCKNLEVISANVLSSLSRLEELYLYDSFDGWEMEVEGHDNPRSNASLVELNHLSHLTTLEVHIPNHQAMPKDNLFLQKLERYMISIGMKWNWFLDKLETSRMLKVKLDESINLYDGVKMLQKMENLQLNGVKNVENILHDPNNEGFPHIKHLSIENVSEIKYVNNSMKLVSCIAFPLLVSLTLEELINLENICYGQLKAGSFSQLKTMKVRGCDTLKNLFSVSVARGLCQLQEIYVRNCRNITKIVADEKEGNNGDIEESGILEFPQLRTLELERLPELKIFYSAEERVSSSRQEGIQSTIDASSDVVTPFFNQKVALPMLEHLRIWRLKNLERLWPNQLADESYPELMYLELGGCDKLLNVFPLSMSRRLQRLNKLSIENCQLLEEIFEPQQDHNSFIEPLSPKLIQSFEFPQVMYLGLRELPKLKGFYHEMHTTNWPSLKDIRVEECGKVDILFASHEKIEKSQQDVSIRRPLFWVNKVAFPAIEQLRLCKCKNLKYVFTSSTVKSFVQLKTLQIIECFKIEEVISVTQGLVEEERVVFPKLEDLYLSQLPNLKRFCCGSPIEFPSLKKLQIKHCDVLSTFHCDFTNTVGKSISISMDHNLRIQYLFDQKDVFPAIIELRLYRCNNLKYVFTSSTVKSFVQLKKLVIEECDKIEEVISVTQGLVEEEMVVFPKLEHLELSYLPNLKRFCCGSPIEFPSLKKLEIKRCDVLSTFHCDCTNTVGKSSNISMDHNLCSHIRVPQSLFNHKVALPMLEHLRIWRLKNLERLWPNQLADESYPKLIQLELGQCYKLLNVFPLSMSRRLQRLQSLNIWGCNLLEEIFEPQQDHSSFIEPLSPKLIQSFEFPQVTDLKLCGLRKLKGFYHEMHTTNWPSLKHMCMEGCDKVEILFASQETREKIQQDVSIQQPLFWVNKFTFPNLESLQLGWNDGMKEIWYACGQQQLVTDYLCKLKDVQVCHITKKVAIIPLYFLQLLSLPNLEKLQISFVDCREIFQSEGVGREEMPTYAWEVLSRVTELRLIHLSELMHLWKEKEGFQNLRILEVEWCPNLKNYLVPSSVSFQNLVTLKVQECGGITKLITHSTAKTLVQLKEVSITDCDKMNEIIEGSGDDEDEVKIEISFPRLNSLELGNLPELESFCSSGNYSFAFPSLEKVTVEDCPKMKMFSQGDSNTPMLHKVSLAICAEEEEEGDRRWEGNLNSTIQQLFKEWNENPVVEEYKYSDEYENDGYFEELLKYFEEHQDNPSTSNTKNTVVEEDENFEVDEDQDETYYEDENSDEDGVDEDSEEHQDNPSTSNTKNLIEEVDENSEEHQDNASTSNTKTRKRKRSFDYFDVDGRNHENMSILKKIKTILQHLTSK